MNDVEYDFLKQIANTMDITDILGVLEITEEDLVNAFSELILEHKYDEFKEFMDWQATSEEAAEEI